MLGNSLFGFSGGGGGSPTPPSNNTLAQTLLYGNSTGNTSITAGTNLSNILQVSDTVLGLSWNGDVGGNVTLDDTGLYLYHDLLTQVESQTQINVIAPQIDNLSSNYFQSYAYNGGVNFSQIYNDATGSITLSIPNADINFYNGGSIVTNNGVNNVIVINDTQSNKGMVYNDDYSANFTPESLVSKRYVLAAIAASTPALSGTAPIIYSAGNISITQATTSTNGYLSSTDWNIFNNKLSATNTTLTSYLQIPEQSVPSTPTNALRLYADTSNRFSWIGENGFTRTFDGTANTASRVYTLPDKTGTIALTSDFRYSYSDFSNGASSVSNSNTLSKSVLIPANTLTNGILNIKGRLAKNGSTSYGWLNIYVNTSNSLSGATLLGQMNSSGLNALAQFSIDRTIPIKSGSFTAFILNTTTGYEEVVTNNVSTVTIDWTRNQYIILAVQSNGGGDTLTANFLSVNQF